MDGGIEAFIEKADEALYLAKKQGKNSPLMQSMELEAMAAPYSSGDRGLRERSKKRSRLQYCS